MCKKLRYSIQNKSPQLYIHNQESNIYVSFQDSIELNMIPKWVRDQPEGINMKSYHRRQIEK